MTTFLEFTRNTGKRVVLNVEHIVYIERDVSGGTYIHLRDKNGFVVEDDFDEVGKLLVMKGYE